MTSPGGLFFNVLINEKMDYSKLADVPYAQPKAHPDRQKEVLCYRGSNALLHKRRPLALSA